MRGFSVRNQLYIIYILNLITFKIILVKSDFSHRFYIRIRIQFLTHFTLHLFLVVVNQFVVWVRQNVVHEKLCAHHVVAYFAFYTALLDIFNSYFLGFAFKFELIQ